MIAYLIRPDGTVEREWQTTRTDPTMLADCNYPAGWWVEVRYNNVRLSSPINPT